MAESKSEGVEIRPLQPTDSVERITEILHEAYAGLADLGFKYFATHQSPEQTRSRLQNGEPFVALLSGEIVGTVTLYTSTLHDNQAPLLYQQPDVGYFGQFGVLPEHQGHGIGLAMLRHVEECARRHGLRTLALDTAEGASHLIRWYEREGYRIVETCSWEVTNYRSVVMSREL